MSFLETNDIYSMTLCKWLDDSTFRSWQHLYAELQNSSAAPMAWKLRLAVTERLFLAPWMGSLWIQSAVGIIGFPWVSYTQGTHRDGAENIDAILSYEYWIA